MTEFICPKCHMAQHLPPELMPPSLPKASPTPPLPPLRHRHRLSRRLLLLLFLLLLLPAAPPLGLRAWTPRRSSCPARSARPSSMCPMDSLASTAPSAMWTSSSTSPSSAISFPPPPPPLMLFVPLPHMPFLPMMPHVPCQCRRWRRPLNCPRRLMRHLLIYYSCP